MNKSKKEKDVTYYKQYIDILLQPGETIEEFDSLAQELQEAYDFRKQSLLNLEQEIKNIKRLKV